MIEWIVIVLTVVGSGCLLGFPAVAAALLLISSTLDGIVMPVPGGDSSVAHLGLLAAFPSLLIATISSRNQFNATIQSSIVLLVFGATISSVFVILAPGVLVSFLKFIAYLAAFFCITTTISQKNLNLWMYAAVSCILLSAALSMLLTLYQTTPVGIHLTGGFLDWNYYAVFLCVWIPIIWQMACVEQNPKRQQWFYVLAAVLCALVIGTRSKSGLLLLALTLSSVFATGLAPRRYLLWLIPVALFGGIIVMRGGNEGFVLTERLTAIVEQPRMQERLSNWRLAFELFIQHPIVGLGVKQYEAYSSQWLNDPLFLVSRSYSGFLVLLAECGILAGLGYCALFVYLISEAFGKFSAPNSSRAILCALIVLSASSLLTNIHDHLFTWCFLGWAAALLQSNQSGQPMGDVSAPCQSAVFPDTASPSD